jgi:hypothetical protein
MKLLFRAVGVAVLALALMNASAGLCFCHRGPVIPGDEPSSAGCCHGPQASNETALSSAGSCCHIESADPSATPAGAIQFAPPAAVATLLLGAPATGATAPVITTVRIGTSPPLFALRI